MFNWLTGNSSWFKTVVPFNPLTDVYLTAPQLEIKPIELKQLPKKLSYSYDIDFFGKNILLCGMRGSGKTVIIKDILAKIIDQLDKTYVVSPTEKMSGTYKHIGIEAYYGLSELPVIDFNDGLKKLVILDDCCSSKGNPEFVDDFRKMLNDKNTTVILALQFPISLSLEIRDSFTIRFLLEDNFHSNQKRLYHQYAGFYESFDDFINDFKQASDYNALTIIDKVGSRPDVFLYKIKNETYHDRSELVKSDQNSLDSDEEVIDYISDGTSDKEVDDNMYRRNQYSYDSDIAEDDKHKEIKEKLKSIQQLVDEVTLML
jgi:hypothetical protein